MITRIGGSKKHSTSMPQRTQGQPPPVAVQA
jgi:hypothetical protein